MPSGVYVRTKRNSHHRIPWNKDKKGIHLSPATEFKKGNIPWSKGKKFPNRSGEKAPFWKGGKRVSKGYILIYKPEHPFVTSDSYVLRSHLVMEQMLERYLQPGEIVHHKGIKYPLSSIENKQDDRPENLQLFPNKKSHTKFHNSL